MIFVVFIGLNKASIRIHYQFRLSAVAVNEVANLSSSIWKRMKVLLASLIQSLYASAKREKKVVSFAVVFSIVMQRSSKVEANQNTAFDRRCISKQ